GSSQEVRSSEVRRSIHGLFARVLFNGERVSGVFFVVVVPVNFERNRWG
uniref:Uncharacterized protein n=1 Tax=Anopheles arabiensis TaxID=7173 RepID=A0A182IFK0_ANOAR